MASSFPSLRLFTTRIPSSMYPLRTLIPPTKPFKISYFRPITFQKIPTKPDSIYALPSTSIDTQPIDELPPKLQEIVNLFQTVQEPKAKYEQLMFYGKNLKPLDIQFKTNDNKVEGCVSQVWVRAYFDEDRNIAFEADSDSVLTKGLAALLVQGLSGRSVKEILHVSPDFVVHLGLQQSLSRSRNNGFLNMLRLMQKKALQLSMEAEKKGEGPVEISVENSSISQVGFNQNALRSSKVESNDENTIENLNLGSIGLNSSDLGSRGLRIKEKLGMELDPVELEVEDVSYQHAGHAGVRGSDGETHFNVKVVSNEFEGKSLVKRHRLIYQLLQEELQSGLHALSIDAKTPSEVSAR